MDDKNLENKIKAWLYDFTRKDENQEYVISDGNLLDDAKAIFEDIIKSLGV